MTGKFYMLGIMRSLNSRPDLRGWMTSVDMGRTSLSDWQWGDEQENPVARRTSEVRLPIRVISGLKNMCSCRLDALSGDNTIYVTRSETIHVARKQQHDLELDGGVAFHQSGPYAPTTAVVVTVELLIMYDNMVQNGLSRPRAL